MDERILSNPNHGHLPFELRRHGFCDVTLLSSDGASFAAHRVLLAAHSPVLEDAFSVADVASDVAVYKSEQIGQFGLQKVLDWCYEGRVQMDGPRSTLLVMQAAALLGINELEAECLRVLSQDVDGTNVLEIWSESKKQCLPLLEQRCLAYIARNIDLVLEGSRGSFWDLSPVALAEILACDLLNADSEKDVWNLLVDWINDDKYKDPARKSCLPDLLLPTIRFGLLSWDEYALSVRRNVILNDLPSIPTCLKEADFYFNQGWDVSPRSTLLCKWPLKLTLPRIPDSFLLAMGAYVYQDGRYTFTAYDWRADCCTDVVAMALPGSSIGEGLVQSFASNPIDQTKFAFVLNPLAGRSSQLCLLDVATLTFDLVCRTHFHPAWETLVVLNNTICIVSVHPPGRTIRTLDMDSLKWDEKTMDDDLLLGLGLDVGVAVLKNKLYMVGGFRLGANLAASDVIEIWNEDECRFERVSSGTRMSVGRGKVSCCEWHGRLLIIGGKRHPSGFPLKLVEEFDPGSGTSTASEIQTLTPMINTYMQPLAGACGRGVLVTDGWPVPRKHAEFFDGRHGLWRRTSSTVSPFLSVTGVIAISSSILLEVGVLDKYLASHRDVESARPGRLLEDHLSEDEDEDSIISGASAAH